MDFARSITPARCSALEPSSATAMASSHMRMRLRSPMLIQSDTAPMVQKWVLLPTAPKTKARTNAPPVTYGASCAGEKSFTASASFGSSAFTECGDALLGARGRAAPRVLADELLQGLLRALAVAHRLLRAGDAEQRVGRLVALRPGGEHLALRGNGILVVALPGVGHADPVLRVRRQRARGVGDEEALHRRDRERVIAELELVESGLVGAQLAGRLCRLGRGATGRGRRLRGGGSGRRGRLLLRLLEPAQASVDVQVEVLLPLVRDLDLVGGHLELAAHAGDLAAQPVDLAGQLEDRAFLGGRADRRLDLRQALLHQPLAVADLLAQRLDASARLVVVEQALRESRRRGEADQAGDDGAGGGAHQNSPL